MRSPSCNFHFFSLKTCSTFTVSLTQDTPPTRSRSNCNVSKGSSSAGCLLVRRFRSPRSTTTCCVNATPPERTTAPPPSANLSASCSSCYVAERSSAACSARWFIALSETIQALLLMIAPDEFPTFVMRSLAFFSHAVFIECWFYLFDCLFLVFQYFLYKNCRFPLQLLNSTVLYTVFIIQYVYSVHTVILNTRIFTVMTCP